MSSGPPLRPFILIVDDFEDTRVVYEAFLRHQGFEVVTAVDAKAAMARITERVPDVIVMDFSLPGVDGLAATRLLKQDRRTAHVPIIILTGHLLIVTPTAAREAGASTLIIKPCLVDALEAEIKLLLAGGSREFRYVRSRA